jgi:hypothetical protein
MARQAKNRGPRSARISGPLLELRISDPDVSLVAQLVAFELALPFLQTKVTTQRQVERSSVSNALRF